MPIRTSIVAGLLTATALAACHLVTRDFAFEASDAGTGGSGGFGGGGGGQGGEPATGGGGSGGLGGIGGIGGAGGEALPLIDDHIIVRYYFDEADMGMTPLEIIDHAPPQLNLACDYSQADMAFVDDPLGRGLSWSTLSVDDGAATLIDGSELKSRLQLGTAATIELVMQAVQIDNSVSHIFGINVSSTLPRFGLVSTSLTELAFYWQPSPVRIGLWTVDLTARNVFHVVLNTAEVADSDRVRLFRNGTAVTNTTATFPGQDQLLDLSTSARLVAGNRITGGANMVGTIYYAAIYDDALTPEEIAQNSAVLTASDDPPVN